jgi:O6-methylguanine-DNA--protein-cysteine methyltransferase
MKELFRLQFPCFKAAAQLNEYFEGKDIVFFKLNPQGTEFQQKYGKRY